MAGERNEQKTSKVRERKVGNSEMVRKGLLDRNLRMIGQDVLELGARQD